MSSGVIVCMSVCFVRECAKCVWRGEGWVWQYDGTGTHKTKGKSRHEGISGMREHLCRKRYETRLKGTKFVLKVQNSNKKPETRMEGT